MVVQICECLVATPADREAVQSTRQDGGEGVLAQLPQGASVD